MKPSPAVALPSWNECTAKQLILDFVRRVTSPISPDFVPENQRVAVFDNDGTLRAEQPVPVQIHFAFDAAKERAAVSEILNENEPFKSLLAGDLKAVAAQGLKGLAEILKLTHTGMTTVEYEDSVRDGCITHAIPNWPSLHGGRLSADARSA